jgi:hypothetical protein
LPPPAMYMMNSWWARSAFLLVAKPLLLFWRLRPVRGSRPMSTMNSHVWRFLTCPCTGVCVPGRSLTPCAGDFSDCC